MSGPNGQKMELITFENGWSKINKEGIHKLESMVQGGMDNKTSFTNKEYMALYTTVYTMCIQKAPHCYTPQLYEAYGAAIKEYLETVSFPAIREKQGVAMIRELVRRWSDHKIMKKWLCDFFRYIDRFYVKRHSKKPLADVCVELFHRLIFDEIKSRSTSALLEMIEHDRNGEEVDRDLLRDAIEIYIEMGTTQQAKLHVYSSEFEDNFTAATEELYTVEVAAWVSTDSCPEYLRKVERRFAEERKRLTDYLHPSSEQRLMNTLYEVLLVKHQLSILTKNTGVQHMLETNAEEDLSRMFQLYSWCPDSLPPIAAMIKEHICQAGNAITDKVNEQKNSQSYVQDLMTLHEKYHDMTVKCFKGHNVCQKALQNAFEEIVNRGTLQATTAELIADFTDSVLRKGGLRLEEKQLQTTLDNIVRLFSYLHDKDMFSKFYRQLLSKRLLQQRSASAEAEKSMIGKLKLRCGAQYTSKLEGMINDMRDEVHERGYQKFCVERGIKRDSEFTVQALTSGFWPTYKSEDLKLPMAMSECVQSFEAYYSSVTNNRKLQWYHKMGVVTLQGNFKKRKMDLVVSAIQSAILLLFNDEEELSIEAIIKHTGLDADAMKAQLRSLVTGQFKILNKKPKEGYRIDHVMSVNRDFSHAQRRLRIPNVANKTTKKERGAATQAVQEDRRHAIEASVVRVMKARKSLQHATLVSEVSSHLMQYFKPDPREIKRRIEDLIVREYLARDESQKGLYHYLA